MLGFVGNGALGAKPGSETLDCASPISVPSHPPASPPPPLHPATSNKPLCSRAAFRPFRPRRDIISPGRAYLLANARSPSSLSSWNELQIRYSYEHNGALLGKYDSVISYSLCRNRLRRTICGRANYCLSIGRTFSTSRRFADDLSRKRIFRKREETRRSKVTNRLWRYLNKIISLYRPRFISKPETRSQQADFSDVFRSTYLPESYRGESRKSKIAESPISFAIRRSSLKIPRTCNSSRP